MLYFQLFCCLLLCSLSAPALLAQSSGSTNPSKPTEIRTLRTLVDSLQLDPTRIADVSGMILQREVGSFSFEQGTFYFCSSIKGAIEGVLFVGRGEFIFVPPTTVEKGQLKRFFKEEMMQQPFSSILMVFSDSTMKEIGTGLTFRKGEIPDDVSKAFRSSHQWMFASAGYTFNYECLKLLTANKPKEMFVACINPPKESPVVFAVNPFEDEEVMLLRSDNDPRIGGKFLEVVNQFHTLREYEEGLTPLTQHDELTVDSCVIDCRFQDDLAMSVGAKLSFRTVHPNQKWLTFTLFGSVTVDSAVWGDGSQAEFYWSNEGTLWVRNTPNPAVGTPTSIRIYYHGKMIVRQENLFTLLSSIGWYPQHGYKQKSYFDLTFHAPSNFTLASVGDRVMQKEEGEVITTRWVPDQPIRNASFNIGLFKEYEIKMDNLPPITILMSKSGHKEAAARLIEQGYTSGANMHEQVAEDVGTSFLLFTRVFGELPVKRFYATEILGSHGEAFPGMLHLAWTTFLRNDEAGFDHIFRAHEVAHQWWGIGVDFATYHDQWLSEGFAEYSGMIYLQAALKDNKLFLSWMEKFRKQLMGSRKSLFGKGTEGGPIWLGYRTQSSLTQGDYDLIIYLKGAWVLHMLRNLVMDPMTMKDEKFMAIMRDFFQSYVGKEATTEDFQRIVEKHVGVSMDWFFQQWVYGTEIPTYRFAYTVSDTVINEPDAPNKKMYKVRCHIRAKDVSPSFKMYLPIRVVFDGDRAVRMRRMVEGEVTEIELPLLPEKPEEVVLNDLESVLCEVETVDWDERMEK
ncbi:MAG: hypothetical protein IPM61_04950 [Chlorobi bacterium]|nr:MAG: Peptidase M1 membrane alanine aminopeptidase [Chlorobi bacterium OLB7]MBK8910659.1 hypothetical protein [Chlorobiota bacterium]MBX7216229.1 hypothetical protein [Candidatus Kapabacteria bacterium]